MEPASWIPVLEGEAAAAAARTISEIARLLAVRRGGPFGQASTAVLHAYLARVHPEHEHGYAATAAAALDKAIEAVATTDLPRTLFGGMLGVGWAIEHLRSDVPGIDLDTNESIDEVVLGCVGRRRSWTGHHDLLSGGLVALGVYALERFPRGAAMTGLARVIDRLEEEAEAQGDGITWRTPPELLLSHNRKRWPRGYHCVGMGHGVAGVVAVLAQAHACGVARARPLLDGAVRWLLGCKQPSGAGSIFPALRGPGPAEAPRRRSAWCDGDPGVAIALFGAGVRAEQPHWRAEALAVARRAAQRSPQEAGVKDAGMCHGAAGLGHIFNRFFQATGEPVFRDAARSWLERALAMRTPDHGLAGYQMWVSQQPPTTPEQEGDRVDDASMLTGVTGTALALLAAISTVEPRWDRCYLTNT